MCGRDQYICPLNRVVDFSFPHNKVLVSLAACLVLRRFALSIISLRSWSFVLNKKRNKSCMTA